VHQLRWHAVLKQWVVVSTQRQGRPQMPADWCPFCPGSGKVPEHYDVYLYPNDFPAFSSGADPFDPSQSHPFGVTGARGACDVVLYSPNHTLPPSKLSLESWNKVVEMWSLRTSELSTNAEVACVAAFENCGEAVGVTMPHPHGQIYAMPFVPPTLATEVASCAEYAASHGGNCIFCGLLKQELAQAERIVWENGSFVAYVPFAARFPAEIIIQPRRHVRMLTELDDAERTSLAEIISVVRRKYDNLYGFMMPLMMLVKQAPLRDAEHPYHFHMQFLPLQRSATKLEYLASIETGYGTFLADTRPEEKAEELRNTEPRT
jgi:UDPglucose--hexose-1-phosphate uridylyltransferase